MKSEIYLKLGTFLFNISKQVIKILQFLFHPFSLMNIIIQHACRWQLKSIWKHLEVTFTFTFFKQVKTKNRNSTSPSISSVYFYSTPPLLCDSSFCSFSMWNLHQIWNPITVLKSARHKDSKTPPTCSCSSFGWDIWC